MGTLNLEQFIAVTDDLTGLRGRHLQHLLSGPIHHSTLHALSTRLRDAHQRRTTRPPEGPTLRTVIDQQISAYGALASYLEGIRRDPFASPVEKAAAHRIHEDVVAHRIGPKHTAAQRVSFAVRLQAMRPNLSEDLRVLPASITRLVDGLVATRPLLFEAMQRMTAPNEDPRPRPGEVVEEATRVIGQLRRSIRLESTIRTDVPPNLERALLGYFDGLVDRKGVRRRRLRRAEGRLLRLSADPGRPPRPRSSAVGRRPLPAPARLAPSDG